MITKYPYPTFYSRPEKTVMLVTDKQGMETKPAKALNYGYEPGDETLSEAAVQQRIFMYHWNTYKDERGRLYHNNNNSHSRKKGAIMKGQGVVPGVADLTYLYLDDDLCGRVAYLEVKLPGERQSQKQKEWQKTVDCLGFDYFIIRSIADFEAVRDMLVDTSMVF